MPNPYRPILEKIKSSKPTMFFDVGIRHGGEWDYFKKELPGIELLALEPHDKERKNFLTKHPTEQVLPYGVWSSNTKKTLVTNTGLCPSLKLSGRGQEIECVTLDWLMEEGFLTNSVFLWIDIEGSELEAFKGATKLLSSGHVPFIYTELRSKDRLRSNSWCVDTDVINYLNGFGYKVNMIQQEPGKEHYDALFKLDLEIKKATQ